MSEAVFEAVLETSLAWCTERLQRHAISSSIAPLMIGVNGAQGIGKTTLTGKLVRSLSSRGVKALSISIDDFYLTHSEQLILSARFADNPFLRQRGFPGTHDIDLGGRILSQLSRRSDTSLGSVQKLLIPSYDKSAFSGLGDRRAEENWREVGEGLDVVFLEGWMLGFAPVAAEQLPNDYFLPINDFLFSYESWVEQLDTFIFLDATSYEFTLSWRVEAEEEMRHSGRAAMSQSQIYNYISQFIPAYETYIPEFRRWVENRPNALHIRIDKNRNGVVAKAKC